MNIGAIVLCGGRSNRMGQPKAWLRLGDEFLLQRIVRLVAREASPIVVVTAPDQEIPALPLDVIHAQDHHANRGPLEGFAAGLAAFDSSVTHAYLTSTDAPLLTAGWIGRLAAEIGTHDAAVAIHDGHPQPLAAVYRTSVLKTVQSRLAGDQLSLRGLLDAIDVVRIDAETLRDIDPDLRTLRNLNTYEDYLRLLDEAL